MQNRQYIPLIVINIYAPTKVKHTAQIDLIEHIRPKIEEYSDQNIILADFNTCLNIELDKLD